MLYNGLGSIFFKEALQEKNSFINILFMFLLSNELFNLQEKILLNCLHIFTLLMCVHVHALLSSLNTRMQLMEIHYSARAEKGTFIIIYKHNKEKRCSNL